MLPLAVIGSHIRVDGEAVNRTTYTNLKELLSASQVALLGLFQTTLLVY